MSAIQKDVILSFVNNVTILVTIKGIKLKSDLIQAGIISTVQSHPRDA